MKIDTQATYTITFSVQAYWNEEGGMGHDTFGKVVDDLPAAILQLELAQISNPKLDWQIICDVTKQVSGGLVK